MKVKIRFKNLPCIYFCHLNKFSGTGYLIRDDCYAYSQCNDDCWFLSFNNGDSISIVNGNYSIVNFNSKKYGLVDLKAYITEILLYDEPIMDESQINHIYRHTDRDE